MTNSELNAEFASISGKAPQNTSTIIKRVFSTDGGCNIETFLTLVEALGGTVVIRWDDNEEHKITRSESIE